ncbi:MAG: VCBS repeat-containing protein [Bacteroidota bacterium]
MKKIPIYILFLLWCVGCTELPQNELTFNPLFRSVSPEESGIDFANQLKENERQNFLSYPYFYNGGGVAIGDLNHDSLPDIYYTGNMVGDRLYLNQGQLTFKDVTISAGIIRSNLWTTGVTMADVNNDGWLDVYVCRSGHGSFRNNLLYINQQNGKFKEQAKLYGLNDAGFSVQAHFFDYDLDGDLDMYLVNHSPRFFSNQEVLFSLQNNPNPSEADKLYRNLGRGENGQIKFEEISKEAGITHFGFGLSASIGDFNQDGYPDIYVANDFFEPDRLYQNKGDGTFSNTLEGSMGHTSFSSMGSDAADINNDGLPDLMVCDMQAADNYRKKANMASMDTKRFARMLAEGYYYQYMQNTLQLNSGAGRFSEIAELAGVSETDWSWGPLFFDMDNDGWKDLFIGNGIRRDIQYKDILNDLGQKVYDPQTTQTMDLIDKFPVAKLKNYTFRNEGNLRFSNQSDRWGIDLEGFSTGSAYADLDRDGDLDLVLNNVDDLASIYENVSRQSEGTHYIQISLEGSQDNVYGIGAAIIITTGNSHQYQYVQSSRGFQSAVEPLIHFGLGDINTLDEIEVRWPNGTLSTLQDVAINQLITIKQENTISSKPVPELPKLFSEIGDALGLTIQNEEISYDDFYKEILLPHKYSQLGPCMTIGDVNRDGLVDLFVGGSKNRPGQLWLQDQQGKFGPTFLPAWEDDKRFEDTGATFFDADGDNDLDLYVCSGSNEWESGSSHYQDRLYINTGKGQFERNSAAIPAMRASTACVRSADFDRDGDIDLFVGGRIVPGQYPIAPPSFLLKNEGGKFTDATAEVFGAKIKPGLVSDALWTDYDNDQDLDLMVVGEWMPITLYKNEGNQLIQDSLSALSNSSGWWYSLAQADMDQDGDMDYVAGNLGLNYKYQASEAEPFPVYVHDFDESGSLDIVLGYFNEGQLFPLRGKQCSSEQMPILSQKFPRYTQFASATLEEVYGKSALQAATHYSAQTFASAYVENLGNGQFEMHPLPVEAQFSSINGILVEDINLDGHLDLVLAGNMYSSEVETARNDAGLGLVLKGDGQGGFLAIPPLESGFLASGDVKSLAKLSRKDESTLILVGNNSDALQAFLLKNRPQ